MKRASTAVKHLIAALQDGAPERLKHVDLTGFHSVFISTDRLRRPYTKTLRQLRRAGVQVTMDTNDYHKHTNLSRDNASRGINVEDAIHSRLETILRSGELNPSLVTVFSLPFTGAFKVDSPDTLIAMLNNLKVLINVQRLLIEQMKRALRTPASPEDARRVTEALGDVFAHMPHLRRLNISQSILMEGKFSEAFQILHFYSYICFIFSIIGFQISLGYKNRYLIIFFLS